MQVRSALDKRAADERARSEQLKIGQPLLHMSPAGGLARIAAAAMYCEPGAVAAARLAAESAEIKRLAAGML